MNTAPTDPGPARGPSRDDVSGDGETLGLAHVASCSYLASRVAPGGLMFWAALGGGMAVARIAARRGPREGYAASIAAIVQTVALVGPVRVNGPLTQALNAPVMGYLQAKGASRATRLLAGLAIRYVHYLIVTLLGIVLFIGGIEELTATYNKVSDFSHFLAGLVGLNVRLPTGTEWAIGFLVVSSLFYGLVWTSIQLYAYERALNRWPEHVEVDVPPPGWRVPLGARTAVILVLTLGAWVAVLFFLSWPVLVVVAVALIVAVAATGTWRRPQWRAWAVAGGLAAVLVLAAIVPALLGAVEWEPAGQRAVRAILLVASATWAREAMGTAVTREVARRVLHRLRFIPSLAEASVLVGRLQSDKRLWPAGRDLLRRLGNVELAPAPVADTITDWIVEESRAYVPPAAPPRPG